MLRPLIWRTLITNFAIAALGLVNSMLLSRWMGPTGRGEIAAAMIWPTLLVYLGSLGLIAATLYFAALPASKPQPLFANSTLMGIAQGAAAFALGYLLMPWFLRSQTPEVISASRLYLIVIPISLVLQYGGSILQGRMLISDFNLLRTVLPTGYMLGTVIFMITGRLTLVNIISLHLLLNLIVLVLTLIKLSKAGVKLSLRPDVDLARQMLKYGGKVHIGNISGLANFSLDQVLMAAWLPPSYLGLYVVAVSAANVSQIFSQAVQTVSIPSITQRESASERVFALQAIFRRYWLSSFLITAAIAAALPVAIPLIFGISFKEALWPAEVLLLGALFLGAQGVLAGGAQALGNPWLASRANMGALVVTAALLYFLLPLMGIMGAAVATAAAYLTQLIIVAIGLQRSHGISTAGLFRITVSDLSSTLNLFKLIKGQREPLVSDQG